jgi:D-alanine-D-alanine ligase
MKKNIAVLMGGYSSEADVSLASAQVVFENLDTNLYNIYKVLINQNKWVALYNEKEYPIDKNDFSFAPDGTKITFDAAFNVIHGSPGEDGPLAGYLQMLGIPQTASDHFESALTFNKAECSLLLRGQGVNIAEAYYLARHEAYDPAEIIEHVGLPCFVKPNRSGSSIGISKVRSAQDLEEALELAFSIDSQIIIEAMVKGKELGCGISDHTGFTKALAITEIRPQNDFFDYESKYSGLSQEITPAEIDQGIYAQIMEESEFIYESLNLRGICRIDYIVTDNGVPFLIEVNTVPGFSKESIVPKQAEYLDISLKELFNASLQNRLKNI